MDDLAQALERFNRTEPDLLFRDAFGHSGTRLCLSTGFRARVAQAAGAGVIPKCAWWAAEYPFNCLAGAILLYVEGETATDRLCKNVPPLVTPGREDVDFVISFQEHLILVEAKAYTANDKSQVERKLNRLCLLRDFYLGLDHASRPLIEFHFLLASPVEPRKLDLPWPRWACKPRTPPWMPLHVSQPPAGVLQVTRCDENGKSSREGRDWRIISGKSFETHGRPLASPEDHFPGG